MKNSSPPGGEPGDALRDLLLGFGENSFRKNYYAELQKRLSQLERFRGLLDLTSDLILVAELSTYTIVDVNASVCRKLGYSQGEIVGLTLDRIVDLERLAWPDEEDAHSLGRMIFTVLRSSGGSEIPVEISLVMDEFENASYVVVVARDISDRLKAEESRRRSELEKALILRSTEELIVYHDRDMKITWANDASGRSLGLPPEKLKGLRCWQLWHRRDVPCVECPVLRALKSGKPEKGEVTGPEERVWYIRGYPVRNEAGELEGIVEFCLDITERKRAEEALRESDRMKTEFISTAAHELRTPLTAIQGFSQLLLAQPDLSSEEQKEFLTYINRKAVALAGLVAELLDIARFEAGKSLSIKKVRCTAGDLLRFMEPFLETELLRHRLELDLQGETVGLEADREKMARVFENLISNAVKYSADGSLIRIEGKPLGKDYEFAISDQGIGMTPQQVEKVFDKFYRADSSNTAVGGIGLGMSIVKNLIEAHGGRIRVESQQGEGTTVRFSLPLLKEENRPGFRKG